MNDPQRPCQNCGEPLPPTTASNVKRRRFCSDACRYAGWRTKKEKELHELIRQLAGRIAV